MPRLTVLDETTAPERTREIFAGVKEEIGTIPNLYRGLGNSPAALAAYCGVRRRSRTRTSPPPSARRSRWR